jgi:large subunit ribosomal protein L3
MLVGLLGKKLGMTQIYDENGSAIPVTLIQAGPCQILQKKERARDGYNAIQLGFESKPERVANRPEQGHFKKANSNPMRFVREVKVSDPSKYEVGQVIDVDVFKEGERVDITGYSKGRGFAGTVKRHHTRRGPESHGSMYHRGVGSMGGSSDPSRVYKGKALPGHMGNSNSTAQNLRVVQTDKEKHLLIVKGSVPGYSSGYLIIRTSVKAKNKRKAG